jgi:tRNA 2-selenouridine synthase
MIHPITIQELMKLPDQIPVLDVRTPEEFAKGHMPNADNLPLFNNEERARVGTTYKQQGREAAILLGFDLAGPKWSGFIRQALTLAPEKKLAVHCWRGGMRSGAMAWALDLYGFDVYLIKGGYKHYRSWVRKQSETPYNLQVIGGMTGSGKTKLLNELDKQGEQIIDLEDLAQHQGSSYGTKNYLIQPSQEQFENNLAARLNQLDPNREIWVEDESGNIGRVMIPRSFWQKIRKAPLFDLQVDAEQRVENLVREYGSLDKDFLVECTERIHKRLGLQNTRLAITAIRDDRMADFIRLVLVYYDKTYRATLTGRDPALVFPVIAKGADAATDARRLLETKRTTTRLQWTTHR